jgi:hypothetical protein
MGAAHRDTTLVIGNNITFKLKLNESVVTGAVETAPTNIKFTCKKSPSDEDFIFQADFENGITLLENTTYEYIVNVAAAYTAEIKEGNYYYDITMYFDDSVYTIMMGILKFKKGIS